MASLLEIVWEPFWKILVPVAVLGFLAVLVLLASLFISQNIKFPKIPRHRTPIHILIVLGSGGHTTEMLYMLNKTAFDPSVWAYRTYVTTSGDNFSANKAAEFEARLSGRLNDIIDKPDLPNDISELFEGTNVQAKNKQEFENSKNVTKVDYPTSGDSFSIIEVPRARKVHQSYLTAPFSTIHCLWACLLVLLGRFPGQKPVPSSYESPCPDVILTNGPAVAVCMMLAAKIIRFFSFTTRWLMGRGSTPNVARLRTIYIESWARVRNLSVSGKLLLPVADSFIVQWRTLEGRQAWPGMKKTQYKGWLVI